MSFVITQWMYYSIKQDDLCLSFEGTLECSVKCFSDSRGEFSVSASTSLCHSQMTMYRSMCLSFSHGFISVMDFYILHIFLESLDVFLCALDVRDGNLPWPISTFVCQL